MSSLCFALWMCVVVTCGLMIKRRTKQFTERKLVVTPHDSCSISGSGYTVVFLWVFDVVRCAHWNRINPILITNQSRRLRNVLFSISRILFKTTISYEKEVLILVTILSHVSGQMPLATIIWRYFDTFDGQQCDWILQSLGPKLRLVGNIDDRTEINKLLIQSARQTKILRENARFLRFRASTPRAI